MVEKQLYEGYEMVIPQKYKWHDSHRNCDHFTDKLNLANTSTLTDSLKKLVSPKGKLSKFGKRSPSPFRDNASPTPFRDKGSPQSGMSNQLNIQFTPMDNKYANQSQDNATTASLSMSQLKSIGGKKSPLF